MTFVYILRKWQLIIAIQIMLDVYLYKAFRYLSILGNYQVEPFTYFIASFDSQIMLAVLLMCAAIFLAFDLSQFTANQNLISILALVLSYWLVSTSIIYLLERAFDEPSVGQLVIMCTNALIGMITLMTTLILQILVFDVSTHQLLNV